MGEKLGIADLRPGDVLLYRGQALLSKWIQHFDGSPASHVAIYVGDGQVGEAIATGVVPRDWETSFHGAEWIRVYRLVSSPEDLGPVLDVAKAILDRGERYGYEQLLMLGLLCTTRKLEIRPVLRRLLRTLLDAATTVLTRLIAQDREPMICSEFVYRCYDQALPSVQDEYSILIPGMLALPQEGLRSAAPSRGVHDESLAALFAAPASSAWIEPTEAVARRGAEEPPDAQELEELAEAYLQEADTGQRSAAYEEVSLEDLRASTDRFVLNLYRSRPEAEAERGAAPERAAVEDERSAAYGYLFRAAPDFVTPADLMKTESLVLIGEVDH